MEIENLLKFRLLNSKFLVRLQENTPTNTTQLAYLDYIDDQGQIKSKVKHEQYSIVGTIVSSSDNTEYPTNSIVLLDPSALHNQIIPGYSLISKHQINGIEN